MKMIYQASVLMVILFLQSIRVDAKADEFLQMKVFNHNFRVSDSEMHAMLKKANLTGHGYKKEVITKLVQKADGGKEYQKVYFFYKPVNCSQIQEVEQELHRLLPGLIGKDVDSKFKKEVKFRHLDNIGQCIVGLEVHFKEAEEGCYANQKDVTKRRTNGKRRGWWNLNCLVCKVCIVVNQAAVAHLAKQPAKVFIPSFNSSSQDEP